MSGAADGRPHQTDGELVVIFSRDGENDDADRPQRRTSGRGGRPDGRHARHPARGRSDADPELRQGPVKRYPTPLWPTDRRWRAETNAAHGEEGESYA